LEIQTSLLESADKALWDSFVETQPASNLYQRCQWREVIHNSYGHKAYYLIARPDFRGRKAADAIGHDRSEPDSKRARTLGDPILGVLPLIHIDHWLFGNQLVSMPYFDAGGIVSKSDQAEKALLREAVRLAKELQAASIELRHLEPLRTLRSDTPQEPEQGAGTAQRHSSGWHISSTTHKVRMVLDLPESSDALMQSFKSKLRSQIRKPQKEGLRLQIGHIELIDDFYDVFAENMRDLGSPVHSKKLISCALREFSEASRIFIVYRGQTPLACSVTIGFNKLLTNPWASSLRRYGQLAPNMLLYWGMLEFGCNNGFSRFDFGRSSPGEGTYKFKQQWGATPIPLYWYRLSRSDASRPTGGPNKESMQRAIAYWRRLPVALTKVIGPQIRKYISL